MEPVSGAELESCPFCEGREGRTPPETFALAAGEREPDTPGWQVRVVPNKYPAFERHEVVIHTPRHARSIAELDDEELDRVAAAWRARDSDAVHRRFRYTQAVINEGRDAGASLAHSHSQLVPFRDPPPLVEAERWETLEQLIAEELAEGERVVLERDGIVAFCPASARSAYELLVAPIRVEEEAFVSNSLAPALSLLAEGIRRLAAVEGPVPLNVWLHDVGHWHLELVPRLTIPASLELGAGVYINTLAPEEAATRLRAAASP
jgi:UDPglucose--hexose-1-phosphate uridylyltransferase